MKKMLFDEQMKIKDIINYMHDRIFKFFNSRIFEFLRNFAVCFSSNYPGCPPSDK